MKNRFHIRRLIILILLVATGTALFAQTVTKAAGTVKDAITKEPVSFASVLFEGTTTGIMTDDNGAFSLQTTGDKTTLVISSLGYQTQKLALPQGRNSETLNILLHPTSYEIEEVTVRPKRERYSRKDNPAVELIRQVIQNKDQNQIESKENYKVEVYEKLALALDDFDPNMEKNIFWKKFNFVKNYVDTSVITGKPILTLSVRENISDQYYRKNPRSEKRITKGQRVEGVDQTIDDNGTLTANLEELIKGVNIFDNNIELLLNRFVSPLSSTLAVSYYQYYIMDTLDIRGDRCVDLAFVPVNSESYGFTGRLYITLDGNYSVKKCLLNVPRHINLNWVDFLQIEQEFERASDHTWALAEENIYINFYAIKGAQQLYAHNYRHFDKYDFAPADADSVFGLLGPIHTLPQAALRPDTFWVNNRHTPLREQENALTDLLEEFHKVPVFNVLIKTIEVLVSGYIPTKPDKKESLFDFGPMNTIFNSNRLEGFRVRVGGMTTANLHPRWFARGYVAYGMNDRKFKYNLNLTHSFNKKTYHELERPLNNLSFIQEYDVYTPGQDFLFTSKDNMFVAWKVGEPITKMEYTRLSMLQYEKEWLNGLRIKTWIQNKNREAAGTMRYNEYTPNGLLRNIHDITTSEVGLQLRFAPGEKAYNNRSGKESAFKLAKDAPVLTLSHQIGIKDFLGGDYNYHHTELSAEKRIWLSSFGHIDAKVKAGKLWNKVPFPLLIMPNTNQSLTIQPEAFNMMNALEFVTDQYAAFYVTYYLKGWIFNRIPVIKWLKLREVVSISGIYGGLTDKNNPLINPTGLFQLPDGTRPLGSKPYLEASVGIDNILKILRVDYYRRLTYLNEPNVHKGGFRIALRFTF